MAVDIVAWALALSGGGGGGGGDPSDYNELANRPRINNVLLSGNKSGSELGLPMIEVVRQLPTTFAENTIYIVSGDPDADPVTYDNYYVYKGGHLYNISQIDYDQQVVNKPKINTITLEGDKKGTELGLAEIKVVSALPSTFVENTIYVVPGDPDADPITYDDYYVYKGGKLYKLDQVDYNTDIVNQPKINSTILQGDKTGPELGLAEIKVVTALPTTLSNSTIYVVPGDPDADPPIPDAFYVRQSDKTYRIQSGEIDDVDYDTEIINRPKIDNHLLEANNNTHESLELISEKDFVTTPTEKTDGMEFILPEGTPDSPIEITEINDAPEMKYANNLTSSNLYINTAFDEINRILDGKVQVLVVDALPAQVTKNTIYFVESEQEGVYDQYIVDSLGTVHQAGNTQLNLDDYVKNTRTIGSHTLEHNITAADLINDVKDQSATLTNKTINAADNTISDLDLSNFSSDVVKAAMPETPTDTVLLTAKAVNDAIGDKQDVITDKGNYYELADTIPVACIYKEGGKLYRKSFQLIKLWGWLVQSCCSSAIPGPENVPNLEVPTSKAVIDYVTEAVKGTRATGSSAFTYNPNTSQGYTINGDYDTNCPRQISKVGRRVNLSFCCKGSAVANAANWTSLGTVPTGYRPTKKTSIIAQVYSGTQNEAAGGYVDTSGWVVIWTNVKSATNNYQVRVNACWDVE